MITVSVLMITYNHEKYISQAINSVLMQSVDFDYELIIGEDFSTDGTRSIVDNFQARYPEKIRVIASDANVGAHRNYIRTFQACQGKYIAVLEGDDYWISSEKLQKQVDFLESHPECSVCFHNALVVNADASKVLRNYCRPDQKPLSNLVDLLEMDFVPTCSTMYRNGLFDHFPEWFFTLPMGDWPLLVFNAQHGSIAYLDEIMAAYRKQPAGAWTRLGYTNELQAYLKFYQPINAYLKYQYASVIDALIMDCWEKLAVELVEKGYQIGLNSVKIKQVEKIFENWPKDIPYTAVWKKKILAQIYDRLYFASYQNQNYSAARYCLYMTVRLAPSNLRNRGVWSIGLDLFLGKKTANFLRHGSKIINNDRNYSA